jgi:hypothetical protein
MTSVRRLLSRVFGASEWHEIETAPFDRELELAVIDGHVGVLDVSYLRHGDGWLDAETLKPVQVSATHWRFRRWSFLPVSCC